MYIVIQSVCKIISKKLNFPSFKFIHIKWLYLYAHVLFFLFEKYKKELIQIL